MTVTDEMVRAAAKAIYIARSSKIESLRIHQKVCDGHFDWYAAGKSNPESCVHYSNVAFALRDARAALTAALSDQVVVPKEPTDAQIISALEWSLEWMHAHKVDGLSPFKDYPPVKDTIKGMYAAMIAAAPPPAAPAGEGKEKQDLVHRTTVPASTPVRSS